MTTLTSISDFSDVRVMLDERFSVVRAEAEGGISFQGAASSCIGRGRVAFTV